MTAPRLNRALVLEAPIFASDGAGGFSETWAALGTLWAQVAPRSGRETATGGVAVSRMGYKITVRAAPEGSSARPAPQQRFRIGVRVFNIEAVTEQDTDARYLICFAHEEFAT